MDSFIFPYVAIYLYGLYHFDNISYLDLFTQHWHHGLIGVIIYLTIGVIWTFPRLKLYCNSQRTDYDIVNQLGHLTHRHPINKPENDDGETSEYSIDEDNLNAVALTFLDKNKMRIYSWIIYWPFSIINTLTGDFVREAINYLYHNFLKRTYLRIIASAMRSHVKEDLDRRHRKLRDMCPKDTATE